MLPYLEKFERIITHALFVLMATVVVHSTIELARPIGRDILTPLIFLRELDKLLHTVNIYIVEQTIHLETLFAVALIAIALGYYLVRRSRWEKLDLSSERKKS